MAISTSLLKERIKKLGGFAPINATEEELLAIYGSLLVANNEQVIIDAEAPATDSVDDTATTNNTKGETIMNSFTTAKNKTIEVATTTKDTVVTYIKGISFKGIVADAYNKIKGFGSAIMEHLPKTTVVIAPAVAYGAGLAATFFSPTLVGGVLTAGFVAMAVYALIEYVTTKINGADFTLMNALAKGLVFGFIAPLVSVYVLNATLTAAVLLFVV